MAIMNPYNYSKPHNFVKSEPLKMVKQSPENKTNPINEKMDQYLESKINAAKPEELTFMLYEGLVKFVKKSILALESKNYEQVNYNAQRAQAIIDGLRETLNMDIEMSSGLDSLYEYMGHILFMANVDKDANAFQDVLTMAEDFRDTWRSAFNIRS